MFFGMVVFADDIIVMSPNRRGAEVLLKKCEEWAEVFKMEFSTDPIPSKSKTKVLLTKQKNEKIKKPPKPLLLNGK